MGRAAEIMRRIRLATAHHDPSYKLKKCGIINAHEMKRIIPSRDVLMVGIEVEKTDIQSRIDHLKEKHGEAWKYAMNDVINTTDIVKVMRG